MGVLKEWRARKVVSKKAVDRKRFGDWAVLVGQFGQSVLDFIDAGFIEPDVVYWCHREGVSLEFAMELKRWLVERGLDERSAELWIVVYVLDRELAEFLWKEEIFDVAFANVIIDRQFPLACLEVALEVYEEYGVEKSVAVKELRYLVLHNSFLVYSPKESFEKASKLGLKGLVLLSCFKDEPLKVLKRIERYMSLGLDRFCAEWWSGFELVYDRRLKVDEMKRAVKVVDKDPSDISYFVSLLKQGENEVCFDAILTWFKEGLNYLDYRALGYDLEVVKRWRSLGLNHRDLYWLKRYACCEPDLEVYERFVELLGASYCSPQELLEWLDFDNYRSEDWCRKMDVVREWFELGVKDYKTFSALRSAGFSLNGLREVLRCFSLEKVLELVDEGKSYKDIVQEARCKIYCETTAKMFKNAIKKQVN